ncbi:MAG TPA: hypothetical protein VGZ29_06090 [Terriglobia bacterium]|nr:hypothetical protein [Terriglobia bacterium]
MNRRLSAFVIGCAVLAVAAFVSSQRAFAQSTSPPASSPAIPRAWDDEAMAKLEVPLADPIGSPKHVSSNYYYKVPVRPIYKSYPIYAPGREPAGYSDRLKQQEPVIVWDDAGHRPPLQTNEDWIKAGEMVFKAPTGFQGVRAVATTEDVQNPVWWSSVGARPAKDGTLPGYFYVIRKKGEAEVGSLSCASCHDRLMPDGSVIEGAQGNFPFDRALAYIFRNLPPQALQDARQGHYRLYGAPWLNPDPQARLLRMSLGEIAATHDPIPGGVLARHRASPFYPVQVPDLIGVKGRRYLDRTGLQQHRGIADLMRYAALNQGGDDLANFDGFVPDAIPDFRSLPAPDKLDRFRTQADRYSDEQLYALALYVYSLRPPPNPNSFDAVAARGKKVFKREGCPSCHTPPLYTNNKLTLAEGFRPPPGASQRYDIMPISVGTDPNLALKTRRGTGYYKVPSLKGVWYRSMFGHSGWCATLEDWFDPRRTRDDYVPTGFRPYGAKTYAVKGHPFGLGLSAEDKRALMAFLRTL